MPRFETTVYQNEHLPPGGTDVHAIVAVRCTGAGAADGWGGAAEILVVDASASMEGARMAAARTAVGAALDQIPDGVRFAVIAGDTSARRVYPRRESRPMAPMSSYRRWRAKQRVRWLRARGGTHIGAWLDLAVRTVTAADLRRAHALLVTDGQDGEPAHVLDEAVERAAGRLQCDCRGTGAAWDVATLRSVAGPLLGSVDLITGPGAMAAEFTAVVRSAMARGVADARFRLWTPEDAQVLFVRQVAPTLADLTARAVPLDDRTADHPTGAWADETREYHLAVRVPAKPVGATQLVGRVELIVGDEVVTGGRLRAVWSADEHETERVEPRVDRYTRRAEMAEAIQDGVAAHLAGDDGSAIVALGNAARLAHEMGDDEMTDRIARVASIEDAATGKVQVRSGVRRIDLIELDTGSVKTGRI